MCTFAICGVFHHFFATRLCSLLVYIVTIYRSIAFTFRTIRFHRSIRFEFLNIFLFSAYFSKMNGVFYRFAMQCCPSATATVTFAMTLDGCVVCESERETIFHTINASIHYCHMLCFTVPLEITEFDRNNFIFLFGWARSAFIDTQNMFHGLSRSTI